MSIFIREDGAPPKDTNFDCQRIDDGHCFLCGELLTPSTRSDEHVFPRWLLRRFDLYANELTLPNGSYIPYPQIRIPCCRDCNNGSLATLEGEISRAMELGLQAFRELSQERVFQWCMKILYGLVYLDTRFLRDRTTADATTILSKTMLEELYSLHLFLQSIRTPFEYNGFTPYSIFIVETLVPAVRKLNFDFHDFIVIGTPSGGPKTISMVAIRCDDIGVICVIDDGAQAMHLGDSFRDFEGIPLHPIQFTEFACKVACKEYSRIQGSRYDSWTTYEKKGPCITRQCPPIISPPTWTEFDDRLYTSMLLARGGDYIADGAKQLMVDTLEKGSLHLHPSFLYSSNNVPLRFDGRGGFKPTLILPTNM